VVNRSSSLVQAARSNWGIFEYYRKMAKIEAPDPVRLEAPPIGAVSLGPTYHYFREDRIVEMSAEMPPSDPCRLSKLAECERWRAG
jgi:hypothetical protein